MNRASFNRIKKNIDLLDRLNANIDELAQYSNSKPNELKIEMNNGARILVDDARTIELLLNEIEAALDGRATYVAEWLESKGVVLDGPSDGESDNPKTITAEPASIERLPEEEFDRLEVIVVQERARRMAVKSLYNPPHHSV